MCKQQTLFYLLCLFLASFKNIAFLEVYKETSVLFLNGGKIFKKYTPLIYNKQIYVLNFYTKQSLSMKYINI